MQNTLYHVFDFEEENIREVDALENEKYKKEENEES